MWAILKTIFSLCPVDWEYHPTDQRMEVQPKRLSPSLVFYQTRFQMFSLHLEICSYLMMLQARVTAISKIFFLFSVSSQKPHLDVIRTVQKSMGVKKRFGEFSSVFQFSSWLTRKKTQTIKQKKPAHSFSFFFNVDALKNYLSFTGRAWKSCCLSEELDRQQKYQFWGFFWCTSKVLDVILRLL